MSNELMYLTWVTARTAVMWVPYILNMILVRGIFDAVGYPDENALEVSAYMGDKAELVNVAGEILVTWKSAKASKPKKRTATGR